MQNDNINRDPRPSHLQRFGWNKSFKLLYPEDVNISYSSDIDRDAMPSQFEEIYMRFYTLGWIDEYGEQCVLMSSILRRILRLHKFDAYMRQYVFYWEKETKGQKMTIGGYNNYTPEGFIDAHMAVACQGYILDFSLSPIYREYGSTAPRGLIGIDDRKYDIEWQDFGYAGKGSWTPARPLNPIIRHWRFNQKQLELDLTKEYFKKYQF